MWAITSSSPTVRTPGTSSIGMIVPQVASTTKQPGSPGTARGTMHTSSRRARRRTRCVTDGATTIEEPEGDLACMAISEGGTDSTAFPAHRRAPSG